MEEILKIESETLHRMFDLLPLGLMVINSNIEVKYMNKVFLDLFGLEPEQVLNNAFGEAMGCINSFHNGCGHSNACGFCEFRNRVNVYIQEGVSIKDLLISFESIRAEGPQSMWLNLNLIATNQVEPKAYIIAIEDATRRVQREKHLEDARLFNLSILDSLPIMIFRVDKQHQCDFINRTFKKHMDIGTETFWQVLKAQMDEDNYERFFRTIHQAIKDGADFYIETALRSGNNTFRTTACSGRGCYDAEGQFVGILGMFQDIHEARLAQAELKSAKERSDEANSAKSEFLANMSHEIRTPLNGIVGMIDLTMMGQLTDEQQDNLKTAKSCVQSLIDIINDILDFSKIEAGKLRVDLKPFDLIETIEAVMKSHRRHAMEKGLDLTSEFLEVCENQVIGDSNRLKQILNNLISNGIKFTKKGGVKVKVMQSLPSRDGQLTLEIEVKDSGIGIPQEKIPMLFSSFTQIDGSYTRQYGGTGLGLVITKQLLEMMGGKIGFVTEVGVGSTFAIRLPLAKAAPDQEPEESTRDMVFPNRRVLLAEDDRVNQIVITKMLESFGIQVSVAADGAEAAAMAGREHFELILMDIQMPVMDGIHATKRIRERDEREGVKPEERMPIVAMTAFALKGDEAVFRASGMDDYVSKPIDRNQMQALLKKYLMDPEWRHMEKLLSAYREQIDPDRQGGKDEVEEFRINKENAEEIDSKLETFRQRMQEMDVVLLEVIAHQIKKIFEIMNVEELKNLAFRMELEVRKERMEKVGEYLDRIEHIWTILKPRQRMEAEHNE